MGIIYKNGIKYGGGDSYIVEDKSLIPVIGTQTSSTGSWTGNIDIPHLYNGLTIAYFLPYAGSGNATLNLTLKDGTTTGAINCYYNSDRLTTHYAKGSNIIMTFWGAGSINVDGTATTDDRWIAQGNYADGNNKTQQTINNNNKQYPLLFSYAEKSNTTTNVTNIAYRNNDYFIDLSDGFIYSKQGFCAGPFKTATAGKRVWVNQNGIYANNFLANYSVSAYERMIVRAWPGKHASATGLLLTVDSGGLTMIGGGESSTNLANLIDNDQTTTSPDRLDINNSQGATGKETTAFTADSEQLILSSDNNIYFITNCQTLANRHGFSLGTSGTFKPMTNNFGSIGSSDYKWQYGYFGQVYGTGSSGLCRLARDNASFINNTPPRNRGYVPAIDLKTNSGDWSIGSLDNNESLIFSYVADSIYSGSTNMSRRYILEAPSTPDSYTYNILHNGNTSFTQTLSSGTKIGSIEINGTSTDLYCETNTNTWRNIKVNGTEKLGTGTGTGALNFKNGTNTTVTYDSGIKISATDSKVTQTLNNTQDSYYPLLFSKKTVDDDAETTDIVYRSNNVYINPNGYLYAKNLQIGGGSDSGTLTLYRYSGGGFVLGELTQPFSISGGTITHSLPLISGNLFGSGNLIAGTGIKLKESAGLYTISAKNQIYSYGPDTDFFNDINDDTFRNCKYFKIYYKDSNNCNYNCITMNMDENIFPTNSTTSYASGNVFTLSCVGDVNTTYLRTATFHFVTKDGGMLWKLVFNSSFLWDPSNDIGSSITWKSTKQTSYSNSYIKIIKIEYLFEDM